jgi:hypothetical protein
MTTVTFTVDGTDYSTYVIRAETWRESLTGIGRWEVELDPFPNFYGGAFNFDDVVSISIDGVLMMEGYLDDAVPFLAEGGVWKDHILLSGRDYGIDLALLYYSQNYENDRADWIVQNALAGVGSEITFASPNAAPLINYEFDRTFMADGIRDLAQNVGYDFYVENAKVAGNAIMQFFAVGAAAQHTVVDLISDANNVGNNILGWRIGEVIGGDVANRVEAIAGPLKDHWTDLNSTAYTPIFGCTVTDNTVIFLYGKGAIHVEVVGPGPAVIQAGLTFPRYSQTVLDLSERAIGRFAAYPSTTAANRITRIRLYDTNGDAIEFYRNTGKTYERTDFLGGNQRWRFIPFSYGEGTEIDWTGPGTTSDAWNAIGGTIITQTFNWSQVNQIQFNDSSAIPRPIGDLIIFDGLDLPTAEVISVATDPAPLGGTRMLPVYRPDIRSQVELDAFSAWKVARTQDPLESLLITAIGQTGTPYASQSLDVRIRNYIPNLTPYRISEVHHSVVLNSDESMEPGYTFLTEYNLVRNLLTSGGTQLVTPDIVTSTRSPAQARDRRAWIALRSLERNNWE